MKTIRNLFGGDVETWERGGIPSCKIVKHFTDGKELQALMLMERYEQIRDLVLAELLKKPMSAKKLAKATGFDEYSIKNVLNALEREGKVERYLFNTWRRK